MLITNDGTGSSLDIDNIGTGHGIYVNNAGILASGKHALYIYSNAIQANAILAYIKQNNSSANTYQTFRVDNSGNCPGVLFWQTHTTTTESAVSIDNDGKGHGLHITQDGVLNTNRFGFHLYSNAAQTNGIMFRVHSDNAASTAGMVQFINDGTGHSVYVSQAGVLASNKHGLLVYSGANQTNSNLVEIHQAGASSTHYTLAVIVDGGPGMHIDQNAAYSALTIEAAEASPMLYLHAGGNGAHIRFLGDPTVASPADGEFWFDGTNLKLRVGSTTYNLDKTAA
jgi:hypothetical protein